MLRILILFFLSFVFGLGVIIGFYNAQPVVFNYLFGSMQMPLIALIAGEFLIAVTLTLLVVMGHVFALKAESLRLKKQLRSAESELKNLRNLPLKDA